VVFDGEDSRFSAVGDLKLAQNVTNIIADGALAQKQLGSDLAVGQALDHQGQDAHFLRGELRKGRRFLDLGGLADLFEQGLGHRRIDQGVAAAHGADRIDQVGAANPFEDVAHRAGADGIHHQLIFGV